LLTYQVKKQYPIRLKRTKTSPVEGRQFTARGQRGRKLPFALCSPLLSLDFVNPARALGGWLG